MSEDPMAKYVEGLPVPLQDMLRKWSDCIAEVERLRVDADTLRQARELAENLVGCRVLTWSSTVDALVRLLAAVPDTGDEPETPHQPGEICTCGLGGCYWNDRP